jgi:hypothetical protein
MTCIVLVQNPTSGGVLAITEGEENDRIAQWPTMQEANAATADHPLVKAWGGYVVDLDYLEVGTL